MYAPMMLDLMRGSDSGAVPPHFLILAANGGKHDRYHVFSAPQLPTPNLDNPIHPIFSASNFRNASPSLYHNLQRSLQFASMFLQCEPMLEWFIRPIFGTPLVDSATGKIFLSNPGRSALRKKGLIREVRKALDCLAHSIHFSFTDTSAFFASTNLHDEEPQHISRCTSAFACKKSIKILIRGQYREYLNKDHATANFSNNLRFDFHLALCIVHEIAHAVGVMRRGNLIEPSINFNDPPKTEHGQSWENFAIGGIINPFDRVSPQISFLTWRFWTNDRNKDYTAIPMSWIAQWFQKTTWRSIQERGPKAVAPPPVGLVLRVRSHRYTVIADEPSSLDDVRSMKQELATVLQPMHGSERPREVYHVLTAKTALLSDVPDAGHQPPSAASSLDLSFVQRVVSQVIPQALQKVPVAHPQENGPKQGISALLPHHIPQRQEVLVRSSLSCSPTSRKRVFSEDCDDEPVVERSSPHRKQRMK